ncbi:MAG: hypothetical protein QNL04_15885 [SAR324 cluster bacterium]|nr:hypothetical protein [SAR324 cluster bacterium]
MDLTSRIFRLIKSYTTDEILEFQKKIFDQGAPLEEELKGFEEAQGFGPKDNFRGSPNYNQSQGFAGSQGESKKAPPQKETKRSSQYPQVLIDDLAVFGLIPPVTFEEVKKARNKEIKSFHPDHFSSDPVKEEAAKKILQLINGAFERLEKRLS